MANYGKEEIIRILRKRDGISKLEAENIVDELQEVINDILDSELDDYERMMEIENALYDYLGLEIDYVFAFL
ncbi:MAG: hypothetical protein J6S67_13740 [Methanobrevibacter sp.]|nr:hypothetical protein [Methanobrevibacter sp.]